MTGMLLNVVHGQSNGFHNHSTLIAVLPLTHQQIDQVSFRVVYGEMISAP